MMMVANVNLGDLQDRIVAHLAQAGGVARDTRVESCATVIARRLSAREADVERALVLLESVGKVLVRRSPPSGKMRKVELVHGVVPAAWAIAELSATTTNGNGATPSPQPEPEPVPPQPEPRSEPMDNLPDDINYRALADSLLLAALTALEGPGDSTEVQAELEAQVADLTRRVDEAAARCESLEADLGLIRSERDKAIRDRKAIEADITAERANARRAVEAAHTAQVKTAELAAQAERDAETIDELKRRMRDANIGVALESTSRSALARLLREEAFGSGRS